MDWSEIFDRLDRWRLLPQYQLERRADIFFSFYLVQAINKLDGISVREPLVPEFPVLSRRVAPSILGNKSFKIDYLAPPTISGGSPVFVELKTDQGSLKGQQLEKTCSALSQGIGTLVLDVVSLFMSTDKKSRKKYGQLLRLLAEANLAEIHGDDPACAKPATTNHAPGAVVVVKPTDTPLPAFDNHGLQVHVISFAELQKSVLENSDDLSKRFAQSLALWETAPASATAGISEAPTKEST